MKTFKPNAKMSHGGHYCWGGKVMKKAEGGDVKFEKMEKMPTGAQQWVRGKDRTSKDDTLKKYVYSAIDEMHPGEDDFTKKSDKAEKLSNARTDNLDAWGDEIDKEFYAMDFGNEGQVGKKRGGKVKAFWETKSPKKTSKKLTSSQKSFAKARAAKAGRPYPNLVDNSAASRRGK